MTMAPDVARIDPLERPEDRHLDATAVGSSPTSAGGKRGSSLAASAAQRATSSREIAAALERAQAAAQRATASSVTNTPDACGRDRGHVHRRGVTGHTRRDRSRAQQSERAHAAACH